MAAPAVVQSCAIDGRDMVPFLFTFGSAVTEGNLLVGFYACDGNASTQAALAANGWTVGTIVYEGTATYIMVVYRYAESGDGTSPPSPFSAQGGVYRAGICYEVSGAASTWTAAFDNAVTGNAAPASTQAIGALTTAADDELLLVYESAGVLFGSGPTLGSPWTQDHAAGYFFRVQGSGHETAATAGSNGGGSINWGSAPTSNIQYIELALSAGGGGPPPETPRARRVVLVIGG